MNVKTEYHIRDCTDQYKKIRKEELISFYRAIQKINLEFIENNNNKRKSKNFKQAVLNEARARHTADLLELLKLT